MKTEARPVVTIDFSDASIRAGDMEPERADSGATLCFLGVVRDHNRGKEVEAIEYQCYDAMARAETDRIISEVASRVSLTTVTVRHRTGAVRAGEASLFVAVTAAHRSETFDAVRDIVDAFKERAPIWKRERYADGTSRWI